MKHAATLGALLATAALMCALPDLMRLPVSHRRADDRLRPAPLRTLTVWQTKGDVGDRKLISTLCAAFEKQHAGVRIFLRTVTPDELTAETAVLPDVMLFESGEVLTPQVFLPINSEWGAGASGMHAGIRRAVPLWYAPNVLTVPSLHNEPPWAQITQSVAMPEGVACQQLLQDCPSSLWQELALTAQGLSIAPSVRPLASNAPKSAGASPAPAPSLNGAARMETLASALSRLKKEEKLSVFVPSLAVSDRARYAAICRDGQDAQDFVRFLTGAHSQALEHGLFALSSTVQSADPLVQRVQEGYASCVLPNAFAHTRQELNALCADSFVHLRDPVQTLLALR